MPRTSATNVEITQMPIELISARMKSSFLKMSVYAVATSGCLGRNFPSLRVSAPLSDSEMIQTTGMKA